VNDVDHGLIWIEWLIFHRLPDNPPMTTDSVVSLEASLSRSTQYRLSFSHPNKLIGWTIYSRLEWSTQSFELTGFQRDLLYVIAGSDQPSGQTIRRKLQPYIDNVNHGRLYPNLDELVDHGLVEKGSQDQRTNYYEVTPRRRTITWAST